MRRWIVGSIGILFVLLSFSLSQGQEKLLSPGELYDSATELFHRDQFDEAIRLFSKVVQNYPSSRLVSYSQYMIGQCYLHMGKYEEALQQFNLYLKTYPEGGRLKEAEQGAKVSEEKLRGKSASHETGTKWVTEERRVKPVKRRICAQVSYLEGKNLFEVEKRIKELKNTGVDTLILRTFQNRGDRIFKFATPHHEEGVYFKTEYAPVVDDILGKVAEIAHRNGLDIFAWITTRYADYGLEGHPELRSKRFNFETKKIELARGYNLFHPDVLKRLEGLFRDLGRYPIDGILFQDDLILKHNEDFSAEANKAFLKEFGFSPHPDTFYIDPYKSESGKYFVKAYTDRFWAWANWKNRWLMDVAGRLMAAAKESNPNLQFAINLYFETVLNNANATAWFSQAINSAIEKKFDYYAIMAYHRQAMKDRNIGAQEAIDLMVKVAEKAIERVGEPSRVMMKIWILDWKRNEAVSYEIAPQKEVEEVLTGILRQGEVSLAFVPYIPQFPLHQLKGKWNTPK